MSETEARQAHTRAPSSDTECSELSKREGCAPKELSGRIAVIVRGRHVSAVTQNVMKDTILTRAFCVQSPSSERLLFQQSMERGGYLIRQGAICIAHPAAIDANIKRVP